MSDCNSLPVSLLSLSDHGHKDQQIASRSKAEFVKGSSRYTITLLAPSP